VIGILGLDGMVLLFGQIAGLVFCVLLTVLLAVRAIGANAVQDQLAGRPVRRLGNMSAERVLTTNAVADMAVTVLVAMVALALSSGLVADLMVKAQP
jgi:hypothetical protein